MSVNYKLVGCSRATVVKINGSWLKDGESTNKRLIKERGDRRLSRSVKQSRLQSEAELTEEYNADAGTSVSDHIVEHPFMLDIFPDCGGTFQQDNCPCHTARIVLRQF